MKFPPVFLAAALFLCGCKPEEQVVSPGRGVQEERGPVATVYPSGETPGKERHGLWRGLEGGRVVWEVRYTRGVPTGPYREWNGRGELIATWPYNWEGEIEGWMRWFAEGEPDGKVKITPEDSIDIGTIGNASGLKERFKGASRNR